MNKRKIIIVIILVIAGLFLYERFMPQPLARDFDKDSLRLLKVSDMNQLMMMDYSSDHTYRSVDAKQFAEVQKNLMAMKVTRKKDVDWNSDVFRDDEVLKIRFFHDESTYAISYTFYENGDILYVEQALINRIEMLRHVSDKEMERVKALVLEGMTLE